MNVEEDCGDGSALRIRPEPSKLRLPEGAPHSESSMVTCARPVKARNRRHVSLPVSQEKTQLYRPRSARQSKQFPLYP